MVLGAIWRYSVLGVDQSNDFRMSASNPDTDWPRTPKGGYTLDAWDEARRRHFDGIGTQRGNCKQLGVARSCLKRAISSGVSPSPRWPHATWTAAASAAIRMHYAYDVPGTRICGDRVEIS